MNKKVVKDIYKKVCKAEVFLAIIFLLITVFVIFIAAVSRTFGTPINWALDIALLLFTWGVFLGADYAYRENKFVNVDIFFLKLPSQLQNIVEFVMYLVIFAFLITMIYQGWILSIFTWHRSFQGIPFLSYTWVTLSVPICSMLMFVTTTIKFYQKFLDKGPKHLHDVTT
jgi:TRAP-type C4-dicarboxylate transport system permease small subunit